MSDNFDLEVVLNIAATGGAKTTSEVSSLQDAIDALRKSEGITQGTADGLTQALNRQSKALSGAALSADAAAKAEQRLLKVQRERAKIEAKESNRQMDAGISAKAKEVSDMEEAYRRLEKIQRDRAESEARESNRQMDARMKAQQKASADAERQASREVAAAKAASDAKVREDKRAADAKIREAERAASAAEAARNRELGRMAELRYANYDIAASYGVVATALTGLGALTVKTFTEMESGFVKVERTSGAYGDAFAPIEASLRNLAKDLPVATADIQDFAARGAQMGIATDKLSEFADTMAKFVATSPEVDVNSIAEAFGRIANLTGVDDFNALASAVAKVGVNSAATDAQIIKTTQELSRAAGATQFTADQIIGLAGAFASLGVAPEAARGIMNQFIQSMNRGAAGLSDSMKAAAGYIGITTEEANKLWKSDPSQFFQRLIGGLSSVDNITVALDNMKLAGQRLSPMFSALTKDYRENAVGQSVLSKAMADANSGFRERTELDKQFAPIAESMAAKQQLLVNSMKDLAYAVGLEVAPALKMFMDGLTGAIQGITDFISTPVGGFVTKLVLGVGALVTAYSTLRTVTALATGAQIAFAQISARTGATGLVGALKGMITGFTGVSTTATGAATAVSRFRASIIALGRATIVIGIIQFLMELLFNFPSVARVVGEAMVNIGNAIDWVAEKFGMLGRILSSFTSFGLASNIADIFTGKTGKGGGLASIGKDIIKWADANTKADNSLKSLGGTAGGLPPIMDDIADSSAGAGDGMGKAGKGAQEAQKEIRTLLDYASDLSSVFKRAFEIRFSGQAAADNVTKTFQQLRKDAQDAADRIRELQDRLRSLTADIDGLQTDINSQKYFLSIAVEYQDDKRAAEIRAKIAKLQAEMASKQTDLAKTQADLNREQAANSKTLTGNTEAAVKNRDTIRGLVESYQAQIEALAKSGLSQDQLRKKTEELRRDFIRQATQLGYSRKELVQYEKSFDDVSFAINNVPRNVDIDVNANPALTALKELQAQAKKTADAIGDIGSGGIGGGGGGGFGGGGMDPGINLAGLSNDVFSKLKKPAKDSGKEAGQDFWSGLWDAMKTSPMETLTNWLGEKLNTGLTMGVQFATDFKKNFPTLLTDIGTWFQNLPTSLASNIGLASGQVWGFFQNGVAPAMGKALTDIGNWFRNLPGSIVTSVVTTGAKIWSWLTNVGSSFSKALTDIRNWFSTLPTKILTTVVRAAAQIWPWLNQVGTAMNQALNSLRNWFINLPANIWFTVTNAASNIWNSFASSFSAGAASTKPKKGRGYADGGYTGAGHRLQPAGIVHKGEYVIPKHMVNQATGLPYADALGRLSRGSAAPQRGYASGGFAGSSGPQVMILSAGSIQGIAEAIGTQTIMVDQAVLGRVVSAQNAHGTSVGAM